MESNQEDNTEQSSTNNNSIAPMSLDMFGGWVDQTKNPLEDGILVGQFYREVPYEFLRGLLSLISPIYGCLIEKYSRWNGDKIYIKEKCIETFSTLRQRISKGVDLSFFADDIFIIGKCEDRLYILAFCKFHKDTFVGCLPHDDIEKAVLQLNDYIESFRGSPEKITGNYLELPVGNIEPKRKYWKKSISDVEEF
jgi:hypothetical protein